MGTQELPALESTQDTWNHLLLHRVGHTLKGAQARYGCCVMLCPVSSGDVCGGVFVFNKRLCMGTTATMINKGLGVFLVLFLSVCV